MLASSSTTIERAYQANVIIDNIPQGYTLKSYNPDHVEVILKGRQEHLDFLDEKRLEVRVDAFLVRLGRRVFEISEQNLQIPSEFDVLDIIPNSVEVEIEQAEPADPKSSQDQAPKPQN